MATTCLWHGRLCVLSVEWRGWVVCMCGWRGEGGELGGREWGGGGVAATFNDSAMAIVCHTVWREGGRKGGREEMQQAIYALCFCCPCGLAAAQRESHYNAGCPCSWPCAHHGCACAALSTYYWKEDTTTAILLSSYCYYKEATATAAAAAAAAAAGAAGAPAAAAAAAPAPAANHIAQPISRYRSISVLSGNRYRSISGQQGL